MMTISIWIDGMWK